MDNAIRNLKEINTMGLRPGNFKGKRGEDTEMFFKKLDRLATYGEWPDDKKAGILPLLLDERASEFYENLDLSTKADYELTKKAVIDHFSPNKSKLVRYSELSQKVMVRDQTVADFHDSLVKDATKINNVSNEQLMIIFINGLPKSMREHVALLSPTSLAGALEMARNYESVKTPQVEETYPKGLAVCLDQLKLTSLETENKKLKEELQKVARLEEQMKEIMKDRTTQGNTNGRVEAGIYRSFNRQKNVPRNRKNYWNKNLNTGREKRKCFYCRRKGHLKLDCFKFKRETQIKNRNPPNNSLTTGNGRERRECFYGRKKFH